MSITYPLSIPRMADIRSIEFSAMDQVAVTNSTYSFNRQAVNWGGQRWLAKVQLVPMTQARARAWISFLTKLKGREKEFYLGDYAQQTIRGTASTAPGTPVVDGGSQTGNELAIDGCPELASDYLKEGDYFSLGSGTNKRLYMNLEDVNIDSGGSAVLDIYPDLQVTPSDNDPLDVSSAEGVFVLADNKRDWGFSGNTYKIKFEAVSVV